MKVCDCGSYRAGSQDEWNLSLKPLSVSASKCGFSWSVTISSIKGIGTVCDTSPTYRRHSAHSCRRSRHLVRHKRQNVCPHPGTAVARAIIWWHIAHVRQSRSLFMLIPTFCPSIMCKKNSVWRLFLKLFFLRLRFHDNPYDQSILYITIFFDIGIGVHYANNFTDLDTRLETSLLQRINVFRVTLHEHPC